MGKKSGIMAAMIFGLAMSAGGASAGQPQVNNIMVTDVTTKSFSVIWMASESSTAEIEIYEDETGINSVSGAVITPHPVNCGNAQIKVAAEDSGVMKVRVAGLSPQTTYYFRTVTTSKTTAETTYYPEMDPYLSVTTEKLTVRANDSDGALIPFSNDVIVQPCFLEDGVTPADGSLLLATISGASHSLSTFVGDCIDSPNALIDLNNAFGIDSHETLDIHAGLNLTLINLRGLSDGSNTIVSYSTPSDNSLSEVKPPAYALKPGWNFVAFQFEPQDTDLENVLNPIIDKVISIWTYDTSLDYWYRYDRESPLWWLNDLTEVHSLKGYWLNLSAEAALPIHGSFPVDTSIQLYAGWNQVGYKEVETVKLEAAVDPISSKISSIWTYDVSADYWYRYDWTSPLWWLNDLDKVEPGKAYWVNMYENVIW